MATVEEVNRLNAERQAAITQYEALVNDKLKVDLEKVLGQRDLVYGEIAEMYDGK